VQKQIETRKIKRIGVKIIYQYDLDFNLIKLWEHSKHIKEAYPKYSLGNIGCVCRG
jgi:hypothetical protein